MLIVRRSRKLSKREKCFFDRRRKCLYPKLSLELCHECELGKKLGLIYARRRKERIKK